MQRAANEKDQLPLVPLEQWPKNWVELFSASNFSDKLELHLHDSSKDRMLFNFVRIHGMWRHEKTVRSGHNIEVQPGSFQPMINGLHDLVVGISDEELESLDWLYQNLVIRIREAFHYRTQCTAYWTLESALRRCGDYLTDTLLPRLRLGELEIVNEAICSAPHGTTLQVIKPEGCREVFLQHIDTPRDGGVQQQQQQQPQGRGKKGPKRLTAAQLTVELSKEKQKTDKLEKDLKERFKQQDKLEKKTRELMQQIANANKQLHQSRTEYANERATLQARLFAAEQNVQRWEDHSAATRANHQQETARRDLEKQALTSELGDLRTKVAHLEFEQSRSQREENGLYDVDSLYNPAAISQDVKELWSEFHSFVTQMVPNPNGVKDETVRTMTTMVVEKIEEIGKMVGTDVGTKRRKNSLIALVEGLLCEIVYNVLTGSIEPVLHDLPGLLACLRSDTASDTGEEDEETVRIARADRAFLRSVWTRISTVFDIKPLDDVRLPEGFSNRVQVVVNRKTKTAHDCLDDLGLMMGSLETANRSWGTLVGILDKCLTIRFRAQALGMQFFCDVPHVETREQLHTYEGFLYKNDLDRSRAGTKMVPTDTRFDDGRMETKCRTDGTSRYRFTCFPGLCSSSGGVVVKAKVWCE
ncbi:hypothetical protein HKX48_008475 [Thoreauomyces humboldtii]|nr:hypothetical protein HKX48_008475 [Thoreauomyces humboldtii]